MLDWMKKILQTLKLRSCIYWSFIRLQWHSSISRSHKMNDHSLSGLLKLPIANRISWLADEEPQARKTCKYKTKLLNFRYFTSSRQKTKLTTTNSLIILNMESNFMKILHYNSIWSIEYIKLNGTMVLWIIFGCLIILSQCSITSTYTLS